MLERYKEYSNSADSNSAVLDILLQFTIINYSVGKKCILAPLKRSTMKMRLL